MSEPLICRHSALASCAAALVSALEHQGHDWTEVRAGAKLVDPRTLAEGARVPQEQLRFLWKRAVELSRDEGFPLLAASFLRPQALHALGFSLLASGSLREACETYQRHFHVVSTAAAIEIRRMPRTYEIKSVCHPLVSIEGFELFLGFILPLFTTLAGQKVTPLRVCLQRKVSSRLVLERYNSFFGLKVEFGAEENLVVFDRAQMMAPLASGNTCVRAAMEKLIAQYLTEMGTGEFRTMVRGQILSQLQAGAVSEEAVARGLSMSTSTLARRLRSEGLNFRELLQETQKSLALQYLQDARLSISEIGFRLGFEDLSSLSRSFRRWTGVSPREWRRQNSGGPVTALAA